MFVGWYIGQRANSDTILSSFKAACLLAETAQAFRLPIRSPSPCGSKNAFYHCHIKVRTRRALTASSRARLQSLPNAT
jgi:hypothetical protein